MKKLLLVTYSFPPLDSVASMRFGNMVSYLKEFGWDTYVLTTHSQGFSRSYLREENIMRIGVNIKNRKTNKNITQKNGRFETLKPKLSMRSLMYSSYKRNYKNWEQEVKANFFSVKEKVHSPNVILSSYGPPVTNFIGKFLFNQYKSPWVIDFRDIGAIGRFEKNFLIHKIDKVYEYSIIKKATAFTTVSPTLKEMIFEAYKKDTELIYNGWDHKTINGFDENRSNCDTNCFFNKKYFYYAGSFYEHQLESIRVFLAAFDKFRNEKFYFIIRSLGPKKIENKIMQLIKKTNNSDRVLLLDKVKFQQVMNEQNNSICNIVFEDLRKQNIFSKGTLTGKFLRMLPFEPPVLFVARSDSDSREILEKTGKGELCSNREEIELFINSLMNNEKKYKGKKDEIMKYSVKAQAKKICGFLNNFV